VLILSVRDKLVQSCLIAKVTINVDRYNGVLNIQNSILNSNISDRLRQEQLVNAQKESVHAVLPPHQRQNL
jgi:hypothetical protein